MVLSATFFCMFLVLVSCKKKDFPIGENTIDANELLASGAVDTFTLESFSIFKDSTISSNTLFSMLGSYEDPAFGRFSSEIYTQFRLSGLNPDFGNLADITVDSLVLALEYASQYGLSVDQTIEVHELDEDLYPDTTYYSFSTAAVKSAFGNNGNLMRPGHGVQNLNVNNMTVVGEDTLFDNQLRLQLHPSIGKKLLIDAMSGNGYFTTNESFLTYFKGVRIRVNNGSQAPGEGGIFYFRLTDPDSKMILYYHENGVAKTFDFLINTSCAYFNHVDITNSSAVNNTLNNSAVGAQQFYAQSYGVRGAIRIPGLSNIPKNAVIHKAVLELPVEHHYSSPYTPGIGVTVSTLLEEGSDDLYGVGTAGYNDATKSMVADIRNYVQSVVNGELKNTQLVFSTAFHNTTADRIIFNGSQTVNKKQPKLYILYTEF